MLYHLLAIWATLPALLTGNLECLLQSSVPRAVSIAVAGSLAAYAGRGLAVGAHRRSVTVVRRPNECRALESVAVCAVGGAEFFELPAVGGDCGTRQPMSEFFDINMKATATHRKRLLVVCCVPAKVLETVGAERVAAAREGFIILI